MQAQLFTINGLSAELGHDRRSLAKWLDDLPPDQIEGNEKKWRLRSVLDHLEMRNSAAKDEYKLRKHYDFFFTQKLYPALFNDAFVNHLTGALLIDLHLSKAQALRVYQIVLTIVGYDILEACGPNARLRVPDVAVALHELGIEKFIAERWPDEKGNGGAG